MLFRSMAIPGLLVLWRSDRRLSRAIVVACTLSLLQVAAFYNWFGGFSVGPRYLTPAIPLLGLAAAHGIARFPRSGSILTVVSALLMAVATAVDIAPRQDLLTPLLQGAGVRCEAAAETARIVPNSIWNASSRESPPRCDVSGGTAVLDVSTRWLTPA